MEHTADIDRVLDDCLERMAAGDKPEACLAAHPHHAEELALLLGAAHEARHWDVPTLSAAAYASIHARARAAFATSAAGRRQPRRRWPGWTWRHATLRFAIAMVVLILIAGASLQAAQPSLPGDQLYSIKRAGERVEVLLARQPEQRALLYLDFAQRRLDEAMTLADNGRPLAASTMNSISDNYTLAWETIATLESVDPVTATLLTQRYHDKVHAQRQQVEEVLAHAGDPAAATALGQVRDIVATAEAPPPMCTARFSIFSTQRGTVTTKGPATQVQGNRVAGTFDQGFLAGYTLEGIQDMTGNRRTMTALVQGTLTATGPDGTLELQYSGAADQGLLLNREAEGTFKAVNGTGRFAGWQWQGTMRAYLDTINPPHFTVTATGPCPSGP
jgi:hypothetical protein